MLIDIYVKFCEDSLKSFLERTQFCDKVPREKIQKGLMQDLWFLHSACRLMLIDIYTKFREDS